jgi:two-component system cell cycle response regulator
LALEDLLNREDIPEDARLAIQRELSTVHATAEKLARERDRCASLIQVAPVIFLVLDPAGRIVQFNQHLEELSGRTQAETRGEDWFSTFLPQHEQNRIRRVFLQTVHSMPTTGTVNAILTRDGREVPIRWFNRTLRDGEGKTIGVLSVGCEVLEEPSGDGS